MNKGKSKSKSKDIFLTERVPNETNRSFGWAYRIVHTLVGGLGSKSSKVYTIIGVNGKALSSGNVEVTRDGEL